MPSYHHKGWSRRYPEDVLPIAINGRFLTQAVTGVQRYAWETIRALDVLLASGTVPLPDVPVEILAPPGAVVTEPLRAIQIRTVGTNNGQLWEQAALPFYCYDRVLWTPSGGCPLLHQHNVFTLPDAGVFATPEAYSPGYRTWYRAHHRLAVKNPDLRLITVSEFSRGELARDLHMDTSTITVTLEGHEHALRPVADHTVLERLGVSRGGFLLAVGSANPNKNFRTLLKAYQRLSARGTGVAPQLVVVGGGDSRIFGDEGLRNDGVVRAGYLSDGELRALYEAAIAFLFPSTYEGFGLPPLEAMALGCPVICSTAASLPEVCGNAALLMDPLDIEGMVVAMQRVVADAELRATMIQDGRASAQRFRWEDTARATWKVLLDAATT